MTRLTLKHAKREALDLLQHSWSHIELTFLEHVRTQLGWRGELYIDKVGAEKRVLDAVFLPPEDQEYEDGHVMYNGFTDGDMIWIERCCEYEQMIGTLIHEALHDCVFLVRPTRQMRYRGLSCEFEHSVFECLPIEGI